MLAQVPVALSPAILCWRFSRPLCSAVGSSSPPVPPPLAPRRAVPRHGGEILQVQVFGLRRAALARADSDTASPRRPAAQMRSHHRGGEAFRSAGTGFPASVGVRGFHFARSEVVVAASAAAVDLADPAGTTEAAEEATARPAVPATAPSPASHRAQRRRRGASRAAAVVEVHAPALVLVAAVPPTCRAPATRAPRRRPAWIETLWRLPILALLR